MNVVKLELIGESPAWLDALDHVSRTAVLDRPVLVIGERGTGKELIGERLHSLSTRWEGPYLKVNCAALSEDLLDSELFGHERGAFTGAMEKRSGRFELANNGTLFLDEIATASTRVQEKLLRVIEYGEFQRLGGEKVLKTDVRIIAATNVDLPSLVGKGKFRADLLDRLAFDVITLPPLRARVNDISILANYFGRRMAIELRTDFPGFAPSAILEIERHTWPGNVRELRNFSQRLTAMAISKGQTSLIQFETQALDPFASPYRPQTQPDPNLQSIHPSHPVVESESLDFSNAVRAFETKLIDSALASSNGHQGQAAQKLSLSYDQFRGLLRKHGYGKNPGKPNFE